MVTKGVASVSSPVRNLSEWSDLIDHDAFVEAVVDEFRVVYGGSPEVQVSVLSLDQAGRLGGMRG